MIMRASSGLIVYEADPLIALFLRFKDLLILYGKHSGPDSWICSGCLDQCSWKSPGVSTCTRRNPRMAWGCCRLYPPSHLQCSNVGVNSYQIRTVAFHIHALCTGVNGNARVPLKYKAGWLVQVCRFLISWHAVSHWLTMHPYK